VQNWKPLKNYAAPLATSENRVGHVRRYNLRAQYKQFEPGESCLILQPDSTSSHALRRWKGPAKIVQVLSPNSYSVEYEGSTYRMHANNLRKFNVRASEIRCEPVVCDFCKLITQIVNYCVRARLCTITDR
jgi:hypothetical protein